MNLLFEPSGTGSVDTSAQAALVSAGYSLVIDRRAPHDAEAKLVASAVEIPSIIQIQINGVRQVKHRVSVSLIIKAGSRIVDQLSTQFETSNGQVTPDQFTGLVSSLNASPGVRRLAAQSAVTAKQHADDAAAAEAERARTVAAKQEAARVKLEEARAAEAERHAAEEQQLATEEETFHRAIGGCREPQTDHDCDALEAWQQTSARETTRTAKTQEHRTEARRILADSKEPIRALRLTALEARMKPGAQLCASSATASCEDLEQYVRDYPQGKLVSDARVALVQHEKKVALKAQADQNKADADQRMAMQQQQQSSCRASCIASTCKWFEDASAKADCVSNTCAQKCQ